MGQADCLSLPSCPPRENVAGTDQPHTGITHLGSKAGSLLSLPFPSQLYDFGPAPCPF